MNSPLEQATAKPKRQAAPPAPSGQAAGPLRMLRPGYNCWRVATAGRAAALIDAANYYRQLYAALLKAERSITILGWDFDGRIHLRPDVDPQDSPALGPLLRSLVEQRPELEIRILVWSVAVVHGPGDGKGLLLGEEWQQHPRIHLHLDTQHPLYASHHQKVVTIDDSIAFAGGIDLTVTRWDTNPHEAEHACRITPDGTTYEPVHDAQMMVDGEAAVALADLARRRWHTALGETLEPCEHRHDCWPGDLAPDFTNAPVGIARTAPAWGDAAPIKEVAALTADAIAAAEHSIYIEAQYLSSRHIADALADRLAQASGPEIVMVVTPFSRGYFERRVLGVNRDRIMRRLGRLPGAHRLRCYYPVVPGPEGACRVLIHAKLMIIDDDLFRVGSGNLSSRSMGVDTECDLAIEATDERTRGSIAGLRAKLVGEHLGVAPEKVAETVAAEGSLIAAIEALNHNARGLRAFDVGDGPTRTVFGSRLIDPGKPFEPLWFLRRRRRKQAAGPGR